MLAYLFVLLFALQHNRQIHCWIYQTECTNIPIQTQQQQQQQNGDQELQQHDLHIRSINNYDTYDDYNNNNNENRINNNEYKNIPATSILNIKNNKKIIKTALNIKCPDNDSYLFIGLTQYGVSSKLLKNECSVNNGDCLVNVDYLADECNGMNSCSIQLDSQYLHSCKNYSNYITIAYKCLTKHNRIDVCSNEEYYVNDNEFYIKTPNYPYEYDNNLSNCTCKIENLNEERFDLKFELLAFDVEEGETDTSCNKDKLEINDKNKSKMTLCGQYKEFKEFNLINNSNDLAINFSSDDSITRRGFLINVKTINASKCPFNSQLFNEQKCVKFISNKKYNYEKANNYCKLLNGNLFQINQFDDNLKLNSYIQQQKQQQLFSDKDNNNVWLKLNVNNNINSLLNIKKSNNRVNNQCLIKRGNSLFYENCEINSAFICEFNVNNNDNIKNNRFKISCGNKIINDKINKIHLLPVNSENAEVILNKLHSDAKLLTTQQEALVVDAKQTITDVLFQQLTSTTTTTTTNKNSSSKNTDFAIIIGTISGILIVVIIINAFFIWNFYNRKIKVLINKNIPSADIKQQSTNKTSKQHQANEIIDKAYFKDILFNPITISDQQIQTLQQQQQQQSIIHVYESIPPSIHYLHAAMQPSISSSSSTSTYSIDPYLNYSSQYLLNTKNTVSNATGTIIVLNGQNYYLTSVNGVSPTQLSTCSSTSSTHPLTSDCV